MKWTKQPGDRWSARAEPFLLEVEPKGDGRWSWRVFKEPSPNPAATGVAASLGAARTATEQYAKRSGAG